MEHNFSVHEKGVDRFYGKGADVFGDYHGGYLNFGLWDEGVSNYLDAAENLVLTVGNLVELNKRSILLDVACGMAPDTILLNKKFGCRVTGLDLTFNNVVSARKRIDESNVKGVKMVHGSATSLPFDNESFSHVIGVEGPVHFKTREKFFYEAFRVLKPSGVLGLSDYVVVSPLKRWGRIFVKLVAKLWHAPFENLDDADSYKLKLERAGFVNVSVQLVGERVIPGYYFEQARPESRRELARIRGWFIAYPGHLIDIVLYKAFRWGLIDYVLVRAEKPAQSKSI